jgi:SAM-dependent methyltransferase
MSDTQRDNFDRYAAYYGLFNQGKNYLVEVDYLDRLIIQYAPGSSTVLELGLGTGRHARLLKEKGYIVTGIERSPKMAALARLNGIDCVIGDISEVDLGRQFDAVLSLFHVNSYLTGEEELANTFRLTHGHLRPNGVFIFDVWYTDAVDFQKAVPRKKQLVHNGLTVTRLASPKTYLERKIVEVRYEFFITDQDGSEVERWTEIHPMKHFSTGEIIKLAVDTGFVLMGCEEYLTGAAPSEQTWGVCYILKKADN